MGVVYGIKDQEFVCDLLSTIAFAYQNIYICGYERYYNTHTMLEKKKKGG